MGSGTWGRDEGDVPVELEGSKVPSLWHYAAAAVCAVTGLVVAIVLVVTPVIGNLPDIQVVMPGEHEIVLEDGGGYTIFYEYSGQVDPRVYSSLGGLQGLGITVRPKAGFSKVELSRPSGSSEYQIGSRTGISVLKLNVQEPGTYIITGEYEGGEGTDVVLAIGKLNVLSAGGGALGAFFGGIAVGASIAIWAFIKRRDYTAPGRIGERPTMPE